MPNGITSIRAIKSNALLRRLPSIRLLSLTLQLICFACISIVAQADDMTNQASGSNSNVSARPSTANWQQMSFAQLKQDLPIATDIDVEAATIRELIPGSNTTAAYFSITNSTEQAITIIGGRSQISDSVEIHTHIEVDGLMRMRRLEQLELQPKQNAIFRPGGMHLMVFRVATLKAQQPQPEQVEFILITKDLEIIPFKATITSLR